MGNTGQHKGLKEERFEKLSRRKRVQCTELNKDESALCWTLDMVPERVFSTSNSVPGENE